MVIYIEYLLIDNLIINGNIFLLTSKFLGFKLKFKKLLCLSLFATVFTFIYPYIAIFNSFILFLFKFFIGLLIVVFIKRFNSIKEYLVCYLFFISATFILGGEVYGLVNMLNLKTSVNGFLINSFELPMGFLIAVVNCYMFFLIKLINVSKNKLLHSTYIYDIIVNVAGECYNKIGVYDNCNTVYDNISSKPVLIISPRFYKEIINKLKINIINDDKVLNNKHYISIKTITDVQKILVFEVDFIKIYAKKKVYKINDVCVGVSKTNFNDYDCIIHKSFLSC